MQGTNTYLIGNPGGNVILLDTGEDKPEYLPLLRNAIQDGRYTAVSDIVLSHYHHDHTMGLKSVLPLLAELKLDRPRIHKIPCNTDPTLDQPTLDVLKGFKDSSVAELQDGQTWQVADGANLTVFATPGHTEDSASFILETHQDTVLFTADTVLGQGTAVFADLKALISSLENCIDRVEKASGPDQKVKLFCGHGPVVEDGVKKMKEYIAHRLQREKQVLEALSKADKPISAKEYVHCGMILQTAKLTSFCNTAWFRQSMEPSCRKSCCWLRSMASCFTLRS